MPGLWLGLWVALGVGGAEAQEGAWPRGPERWWESVEAGWSATYEIQQGSGAQEEVFEQTWTIVGVEGSEVTYTIETRLGEQELPLQEETVDMAGAGALAPRPEGAEVEVEEERVVEVGGQAFRCVPYTVRFNGQEAKLLHCAGLPPLFMGGNVEMVASFGGVERRIRLVGYTGGLLDP